MPRPAKHGLMAQVLSRMASGDSLISNRHAESMLVGLLGEAEKIADPAAAWEEVRTDLVTSWDVEDGPAGERKPFIYRDGAAIIPVHGILINRFNHCWGFVTGYDFIRRQKNQAEADPDVKLIVYDHDTPGGEAAGCDELAQEIYASRAVKPSLAVVNTLSASGGYWLASPCSRVVCAPSGSVGSIGVYIQHMMIARMLQEWGIEVEFIKRGEFKTSGNMFEPLSKADRQYLQEMVDERYDEFVSAVAQFRGIEESVARDTQARVMRPTEALSLGLIDAAVSPAEAVSNFLAELGRDEPLDDDEEQVMADELTTGEITSEQRAEIAGQAKARIKGIMTHAAAEGRSELAEHLAYDTDMTIEAAAAILEKAPKVEAQPEPAPETQEPETPAPEQSRFETAMDQGTHPDVGPNAGGAGNDDDEGGDRVSQIIAAQEAMFGTRRKTA